MKIKNLKLISYAYLMLPVIFFVLGWVKLIYSIPITAMLIYIYNCLYKQFKDENDNVITKKGFITLFICITIICVLGGHGGFFYQTSDWNARNAIFRDLINFDWPVMYEKQNTAMTYYIGQWIVPATITKTIEFAFVNILGNVSLANTEIWFNIGNVILLFWNSIGVTLACIWVLKTLKIQGKKSIIAIFIFLGFSGLDLIGTLCTGVLYQPHFEWWATYYQYSAMITQLFWVFNQCIAVWMITLMFLDETKVNNYMLLILLSVPFSPLGTVGLAILFLGKAIKFLIDSKKEGKIKEFFKDVFSIQNILAFISIFPIYLLYYLSNSSTQGDGIGGGFNILWSNYNSLQKILRFVGFLFLEIGIYFVFLLKSHEKESFFYVVLLSLIFIPLFQLGYAYDFCMRVSIPALLVVDVWIIDFVMQKINNKKVTVGLIALTIVFVLAIATPLMEFYRGFYYAKESNKINLVFDKLKTFEFEEAEDCGNFLTSDPKNNSFFYKYIAK